ncbi:heat shock 70 kDa protein 12A-like [Mya arenaria]|uniref:heat shock 70 kDa protein 12A-like n=1 Tax=Mya arenaria TaxID=6604 RepID=UPI0022E7DCE7|nr:heat shock 70 kDa protein 12A-like [Mya arenaria]
MDRKFLDELNRKLMVKQPTRKCPESDDEETYARPSDRANREREPSYQLADGDEVEGRSVFRNSPKRDDEERGASSRLSRRSTYQLSHQKAAERPSDARRLLNKDASRGALSRPSWRPINKPTDGEEGGGRSAFRISPKRDDERDAFSWPSWRSTNQPLDQEKAEGHSKSRNLSKKDTKRSALSWSSGRPTYHVTDEEEEGWGRSEIRVSLQRDDERDAFSWPSSKRLVQSKVKPKAEFRLASNRTKAKNTIVTAAIDFGTTYTGYAFSFKHEFKKDPLKINANEWRNVDQGQMKCKTPTCLLLNADRSLNSFGHEAKLQYKEICLDKKEDKYYFFWNFKMTLHQQKEIKGDFNIKAQNGHSIDALTVFSRCIEYLKNHMMEILTGSVAKLNISDVTWVVTVPAIWNESAKKFMRLAAEKAGLPKNHIEIALEPEAASLYCRQLPIAKDPETENGVSKLPVESQYMILDCGGGTVDVTVHEVLSNGRLKELYAATGGKWGGMVVDKKFLSFIAELVGDQVFESFVKDNKDDYFDLLDDFETKKRVAGPSSSSTITIKIPTTLQEQLRRFSNRDHGKKDVDARDKTKVRFMGDKLRIDAKQFNSFFDEAVGDIVAHVHDLLESLSYINIKTIIMVGGFSESPVLQNAIRAAFGRDREIIIPQDASLCVMKGAVLFGHQPSIIAERKARFTFGFAMVKHFNRFKHPEEKKIEIDGEALCNDLFDKHIEIGAAVKYGETQAEKLYFPMSPNDTVFPVALFRSTDPNPKFVDERSCDCVGYFLAKRPTESIGSINQIRIRLILGNSDISVETVKCDGSVEKSDFKINET